MLTGQDDRGNVIWRLKDVDLAATLSISPQRWSYVKKLLLEGVEPSKR